MEYTFKNSDGTLSLVRCPICQKENYVLNVISGKCTFCGYDANETEQQRVKREGRA